MIGKDDLLCIGYIKRPHGFKGNIHIEINHEIALDKGDFVFLKLEGKFIPYPVDSTGAGKHSNTVKLRFVDDFDEAKALTGTEVYIEASSIPEDDELALIGYMIVDKVKGKIAKVSRIEYYPQQLMLIIELDGQEKFIPLNDHIVLYIDQELKEIHCDLPTGLLDL